MPYTKRRVYKTDKNYKEMILCLKTRCAGYEKDSDYPWHYANLRGLRVALYDTNKVGSGFPDCEVWVSWLCLQFEVKQERPEYKQPKQGGGRVQTLTDKEYYMSQLEGTELFYRNRHPSIVPVVWDRNQVFDWLNLMADFVEYVEGQSDGAAALINLFFPSVISHNAK